VSHVDAIDSDTARALEVLRGVSRGPRDPDFELLAIVAEIDREPTRLLDRYLQQLVRDAHIN
jgi:hypothetical protein